MVACLCLHGYTGSKEEVKPLADYLRAHTDWDVLTPTLPGHDHLRHLKRVTYKDWLIFLESILTQLLKEDEEVYIVGFSMGGLLAGWLARHYPQVKKLVLLSTAVNQTELEQIVADSEEVPAACKKHKVKAGLLSGRYKEIDDIPLSAADQFRKMANLALPVFEHIDIPTFIAQGSDDSVVAPTESVDYLMKHIPGPKEVFILEGSKHLICLDKQAEALFRAVLVFLEKDNAEFGR